MKNIVSRRIECRMPIKPQALPFQSIQAFQEFENNENLFNEIVSFRLLVHALFISIIILHTKVSFYHFQVAYFKWLGGYTLKDCVHYCMTNSISTELSQHFTWWGNEKKEKLPLYKSKLTQAIYRTYMQRMLS